MIISLLYMPSEQWTHASTGRGLILRKVQILNDFEHYPDQTAITMIKEFFFDIGLPSMTMNRQYTPPRPLLQTQRARTADAPTDSGYIGFGDMEIADPHAAVSDIDHETATFAEAC